MYFFPLASKTPPFPLLCTLYNSLMTRSGELVGCALCAACEKRLPKITSRGINEKLIVLIVSVPQKFAIFCNIKEAYNVRVGRARRLHSTFDSIAQVAKGAARAPVQRLVGCGLCNSRPYAHSIPEKNNT